MARIAGVDIPREKRLEISLTYIFGVGLTTSQKICDDLGLDPDTKVSNLTEDEVKRIANEIEQKYTVEGALRRLVQGNIQRLKDIACWRGLRHRRGLPVRGQRTSTNARTRKGPRRTVGVMRSKEARSAAKSGAK